MNGNLSPNRITSANMRKVLSLLLFLLFSLVPANAGIDWSRYDDGPEFFIGWKASFFCAIAAIVLFYILSACSKKSSDPDNESKIGGCLSLILTIAMVVCGVLSYYLLTLVLIVIILIQAIITHKKKS